MITYETLKELIAYIAPIIAGGKFQSAQRRKKQWRAHIGAQ